MSRGSQRRSEKRGRGGAAAIGQLALGCVPIQHKRSGLSASGAGLGGGGGCTRGSCLHGRVHPPTLDARRPRLCR